jgi:hypothetical protein
MIVYAQYAVRYGALDDVRCLTVLLYVHESESLAGFSMHFCMRLNDIFVLYCNFGRCISMLIVVLLWRT